MSALRDAIANEAALAAEVASLRAQLRRADQLISVLMTALFFSVGAIALWWGFQ